MEPEEKLETLKNEVLRKIGRNMLNFQNIEGMLKFLVANGTFSGYISELELNKQKKAETIRKQTMGQLIGQHLENTYTDKKNIEPLVDLEETHFSFQFNVECEKSHYENKKQALALLVDQRNDLIHHLIPKFNPNSIESCLEIEQYLEQQHKKLIPELNELREMCNRLLKLREQAANYLLSDEAQKDWDISDLILRLVNLLTNISSQTDRKDGWTLLNTVGQHAPEEIAELKAKLGHKTLKALILATGLFDIKEEPTKKGGMRVLYRLKPDQAIKSQ